MTIARWGWTNIIACAILCLWSVSLLPAGWVQVAGGVIAVVVFLFTVAFFRNPAPRIPEGDHLLVSPATGVVADIEEVDEEHFINGRALRIGIFLSVFDVHVNRSPMTARIVYAHYKPGAFFDARHPDATHQNEANTLGLLAVTADGAEVKLVVRQISGLIARRIICVFGPGDELQRGELYGMIKFGSRTELYLPVTAACELQVSVGQKVRCGETVLAALQESDV